MNTKEQPNQQELPSSPATISEDEIKYIKLKSELISKYQEATRAMNEHSQAALFSVRADIDHMKEQMQKSADSFDNSHGNRMNHVNAADTRFLLFEQQELLDAMSSRITQLMEAYSLINEYQAQEKLDDISRTMEELDTMIDRLCFDSRFYGKGLKIYDRGYSRVFAKNKLSKVFNQRQKNELSAEEAENEFSKCFLLEFDLDGLKIINDFAGHDKGTEYLAEVVRIFLHDQEILSFSREHKLYLHWSAEGGDEFACWGEKQDGPMKPELRKDLMKLIKSRVGMINMHNIIDFSDDLVQENLKDEGLDIPKESDINASIAGGHFGVEESIYLTRELLRDRGMNLRNFKTGSEMAIAVMEQLFTATEGFLNEDKKLNYRDMAKSAITDPRNAVFKLLNENRGRGIVTRNEEEEIDAESEEDQESAIESRPNRVKGALKNIREAIQMLNQALAYEPSKTLEQIRKKVVEAFRELMR